MPCLFHDAATSRKVMPVYFTIHPPHLTSDLPLP